LVLQVAAGQIGVAERWQGADVVITNARPAPTKNGFYPDPRFVITIHVIPLSWLFLQLRDLFNLVEGYGAWKEELFGRLGNMSERFLGKNLEASAQELLLAVLREAYAIFEEMGKGDFGYLSITFDNRIFDDSNLDSEALSLLTVESIRSFFTTKGLF
jgi:hypothetical protein